MLGYKYVNYKKCAGFPESALNKVKANLENNKLSYKIFNKDNLICEYKGIAKNYNLILKKALKKINTEIRMNRITEIIENLNEIELNNLIEVIENGNFK